MNEKDIDEGGDLIFCEHCNELVSRSTFERHERKRAMKNLRDSVQDSSASRVNWDSK